MKYFQNNSKYSNKCFRKKCSRSFPNSALEIMLMSESLCLTPNIKHKSNIFKYILFILIVIIVVVIMIYFIFIFIYTHSNLSLTKNNPINSSINRWHDPIFLCSFKSVSSISFIFNLKFVRYGIVTGTNISVFPPEYKGKYIVCSTHVNLLRLPWTRRGSTTFKGKKNHGKT